MVAAAGRMGCVHGGGGGGIEAGAFCFGLVWVCFFQSEGKLQSRERAFLHPGESRWVEDCRWGLQSVGSPKNLSPVLSPSQFSGKWPNLGWSFL